MVLVSVLILSSKALKKTRSNLVSTFKVNNKPAKEDFQEIPKKMKFLMDMKVKTASRQKTAEKSLQEKPIDLGLLDSTKYLTKVKSGAGFFGLSAIIPHLPFSE